MRLGAGVIVGSALLRAIGEAPPERAGEVTREFLSQMVQAMRPPSLAGGDAALSV